LEEEQQQHSPSQPKHINNFNFTFNIVMSGLRSTTTNWSGPFLKSALCPGTGLVVEGVVDELRAHSVFVRETSARYDQSDALPSRYIVLVMRVNQSYERIFDKRGGMHHTRGWQIGVFDASIADTA
jgi:hypothetical protein